MTIGPDQSKAPAPDDDQHPNDAGRTIPGSYPHKMIFTCGQLRPPKNDERHDKRQGLLNLASRILSSWGYTARMIALVGALLAILVIGIGVLRLTVDVGPLRVSGNTSGSVNSK